MGRIFIHTKKTGWRGVRQIWNTIQDAVKSECSAGIPLALSGQSVTVAKGYLPKGLGGIYHKDRGRYVNTVRNIWWSTRLNGWIIILEHKQTGKVIKRIDTNIHDRMLFLVETASVSVVWSLKAEARANKKLRSLIDSYQYHCYRTLGYFIEVSKRSGVCYVFRRAKPTLAIRMDAQKILAGLCLHSVGFYDGTFAGALVPTDDVIAHLLLMRADEHGFWKKSNQHAPDKPNCAV